MVGIVLLPNGRNRKYCFAEPRCRGEIPDDENFADGVRKLRKMPWGGREEGLNKEEMKQEGIHLGIESLFPFFGAAEGTQHAFVLLLFKKKQLSVYYDTVIHTVHTAHQE